MKKTKIFSRIFAAALAAAVTATTLITNSGTGLLAFATEGDGGNGSSETYSVKIISPDVPADGKTYSYKFYQIIDGNVEDDGGVNVLGNAKWGAALGGEDFDTEKNITVSQTKENVQDITLSKSEALFTLLSGSHSYQGDTIEQSYYRFNSVISSFFETEYVEKYYGIKSGNSFKNRFVTTGATQTNPKPRTAVGLVELLNEGVNNASLKSFTDLLYSGLEARSLEFLTTGDYVNIPAIKFIDNAYVPKEVSINAEELTVTGLNPGYYLVACVADDKLTNDGYETSMPVKPVSTMLILVGPANKGVAEIVGKNAYTVPTVTLDMYQKPVQLDYTIKTGGSNWNSSGGGGFDHNVEDIETIIQEDNWEKTGSFDYYSTDRQEAILYRIGVTLPLNFDSYKDSGYFLAVLDQYGHFGTALGSREIDRVDNVRPYIYVKDSSGNYTLVGRCRGNGNDTSAAVNTDVGEAIIKTSHSNFPSLLTGSNTGTTVYNDNEKLGFYANDLFCLGNLYDYTTGEDDAKKCIFNPGDTIYIYYPAILRIKGSCLLNANRVWAVYTNNPYAQELKNVSGDNGYTHITNGDVGITPISEANVNTYSVKLTVGGEEGYTNGAKFALYREVVDGKNKTREYAYTSFNTSSGETYIQMWIPESELEDELNDTYKTIEDVLLNYSKNSSTNCAYLSSHVNGISNTSGVTIKGLAAGDYYLRELTISSSGVSNNQNTNNAGHENIITKHYKLAEEPIKFSIGNEYNQSVSGYLGVDDNQKTFIEKLTVDFLQENQERAIDTYIYKPYDKVDEEGNPVPTKNGSVTTTLATTTSEGEDGSEITATAYATEDGEIEIQVYHKTINLIWLPETGGIGTTIFFIVGGAIVVAATVLIVTRFRVKRERL